MTAPTSTPVTSPEQHMTLERLKSLYELIRRMNSVYDLPELLDFVVDRVIHLAGRPARAAAAEQRQPVAPAGSSRSTGRNA